MEIEKGILRTGQTKKKKKYCPGTGLVTALKSCNCEDPSTRGFSIRKDWVKERKGIQRDM